MLRPLKSHKTIENKTIRHGWIARMIRNLEVLEGSEGKTPVAEAAPRYRRAHPFDLATYPFDLQQILIYVET